MRLAHRIARLEAALRSRMNPVVPGGIVPAFFITLSDDGDEEDGPLVVELEGTTYTLGPDEDEEAFKARVIDAALAARMPADRTPLVICAKV